MLSCLSLCPVCLLQCCMFGFTAVWCLLVTTFTFYLSFHGSWDFVVIIASSLLAGQLRNCGLILDKGIEIPSLPPNSTKHQDCLWYPSSPSIQWVLRALSSRVKWLVFEASRSPKSSVPCTFIACTGTYLWFIYVICLCLRFYFALLYQQDRLWDERINMNGCQEEWWLIVLSFYYAVLIYKLMRICDMSNEG